MIEGFLSPGVVETPAFGVISPHAGYPYSGAIAGEVFSRVRIPKRILILGPNHHGYGHPAAIFPSGVWHTPLGPVSVDGELVGHLLKKSSRFEPDKISHQFEHSIEVQIPFLQVRRPDLLIVPICVGSMPLEELIEIGEQIGEAIASFPEEILLVASTDMTHYAAGAQARKQDMRAIEKIKNLDPRGLFKIVREEKISMCGVLPVVIMLKAALKLGAKEAVLVHYGNSGDITGDQSQVVGYAGMIVPRPEKD